MKYSSTSTYSQHPLIRTLKGPKTLFELANAGIIESGSRTSEWKKNTRNCLLAFISGLNVKWVHFLEYTVEGHRLHAFFLYSVVVLQFYN